MKYLARISYDGSKFEGFQRLNNGRGVQNTLERVLSKIENKEVFVKGAGRTDAKVHALDQCIHFELKREISLEKLRYVMNRMLPDSISVSSIRIVDNSFHARHSVRQKTYLYKVYVGEKNPFFVSYAYCLQKEFSLEKMCTCSNVFLGIHDFHNFVSGERVDYTSRIDSILITREADFIIFEVTGKSFYRYMVRSLVGALLDVGCGKRSIDEVRYALDKPNENIRFTVVPAQGLYLYKIQY